MDTSPENIDLNPIQELNEAIERYLHAVQKDPDDVLVLGPWMLIFNTIDMKTGDYHNYDVETSSGSMPMHEAYGLLEMGRMAVDDIFIDNE